MSRVVSSEAFAYFKDAGAYDTNASNCNGVKGLPNIVTGSVVYKTLRDGYDKLPAAMVDKFREAGGEYVSGARLLRIEPSRTQRQIQELSFSGAPPVEAGQVVLAMPRHALEQIRWAGFDNPEVRTMIRSVLKQPAFKMFLGYEYPWWRPLGLVAGRSITDMPLRQCYYFGTEGEQPGADKRTLNSLLMATYNDVETVPFWRGFENDRPFRGQGLPGNEATEGMVRAAQQQLAELHGLRELPAPYAAAYQDWTRDPYGAGWHVWKAGFEYNKLMPKLRKPVPDAPVHICGEAYSNEQGWVEGALQTAERMLEEHFGMARPRWLPADYDLGP
jgi:monoamine oxidase